MTEEFKKKLIDSGLTKQQAEGKTAEHVLTALMGAEEQEFIKEAREQLHQIRSAVINECRNIAVDRVDLDRRKRDLSNAVEETISKIEAIEKAKNEYGEITDERAKNCVRLFAAINAMNNEEHYTILSGESIGYILYAYLIGGKSEVVEQEGKL